MHITVIELIFHLDYSKYYDDTIFSDNNGVTIICINESIWLDPKEINLDTDLYHLIINHHKWTKQTKELFVDGFCLIDSEYCIHSIKNALKQIIYTRDLTLIIVPFTLHMYSLIKLLFDDMMAFIMLESESLSVIKCKNFMLEILNILSSIILNSSFMDKESMLSLSSIEIPPTNHTSSGTGLLFYDYLILKFEEAKVCGNNGSQLLYKSDNPKFIFQHQSHNIEFLTHLNGELARYHNHPYKIDCTNPIISEYCKLLLFTLINYSHKTDVSFNLNTDCFILILIKLIQNGSICVQIETVHCIFDYLNKLLLKSQCRCWVVVDVAIAALFIVDKIICSDPIINNNIKYNLEIVLDWMISNVESICNINLQLYLSKVYFKLVNTDMCEDINQHITQWIKLLKLYDNLNMRLRKAPPCSDHDLVLGWICLTFSIHSIMFHYMITQSYTKETRKTVIKNVANVIDKLALVQYEEIDVPKEYNVLIDLKMVKEACKQLDKMLQIVKSNFEMKFNPTDYCFDYSILHSCNVDVNYFKPLLWSVFTSLLNSKEACITI